MVGVCPNAEECQAIFVTRQAQLLRTDLDTVRLQGRAAGGVAGIKLAKDDEVIAFNAIPKALVADAWVLTVVGAAGELPGVTAGSAKLSPFADFPVTGRAGLGVRAQRFLKGEYQLDLAWWATIFQLITRLSCEQ